MEALNSTAATNRTFYYDYVLSGLNEAARKELEGLMSVGTYEWQSDFAREYVGIGREEGREEGAALGVARSVIAILETRGFTPTTELRERVEACTDLQILDRWLRAALRVDRPEDLFDPRP